MTYPGWKPPREVVGAKTVIRFTFPFRHGTEYTIARIDKQFYVLRYDIMRDGERIGQARDYPMALWQVAVDFACRLSEGPLGLFLLDEDRLTDLVWRFVRRVPENRVMAGTTSNAYRSATQPERKPKPQKARIDAYTPVAAMLAKQGFISWENAAVITKSERKRRERLFGVETASVVTRKRR